VKRWHVVLIAVVALFTIVCVAAVGVGVALLLWTDVGRVGESDVYGVYVAHHRGGTETLTLNRDHTFRQEIQIDGAGALVTNDGVWVWRDSQWGSVDLRDCLGVGDGRGGIRPDFASKISGCGYPPERKWFLFGQIRLGSDEAAPLWKVASK